MLGSSCSALLLDRPLALHTAKETMDATAQEIDPANATFAVSA